MVIAMTTSGDSSPNATRVMRRILVLTDSTRPLDSPCFDRGEYRGLVFDDAPPGVDESRDAAATGPAGPTVERVDGLVIAELGDQPEASLST